MSGDLISRSALMQALRNNVLIDVTPNLEQAIEEQPIAYDVDKVVERLEKVNEDDNICEKFIKNDRKRCKNARGCFDCAIRESIAIIKSGGIE